MVKKSTTQFSILLIGLMLIATIGNAQHKCKSHVHRLQKINQNPNYAQVLAKKDLEFKEHYKASAFKKQNDIISIPVVFHVLYHEDNENVSNEQILSQLQVLNDDFNLYNADKLESTHPFYDVMGNCQIEFCLAKTDPNGNSHSGVTRTYTDSAYWAGVGNEKFTSEGGHDNWDPERYLNIWVCNLDEEIGTLGYSSFPTDLEDYPEEDGVVIHYRCFGTTGTAGSGDFEVNDGGRTGTHEVGHWLYLEHIWGDEECGTDGVNDTPPHEWDNYDCPSFPHNANNSCGGDADGEMYMNYMDYVDDDCMVMFTIGQKNRMRTAIETFRPELLTGNICSSTSVNHPSNTTYNIELYPNPTNVSINLKVENTTGIGSITICNTMGQVLTNYSVLNTNRELVTIDVSKLATGYYTLFVNTPNGILTKSFSKNN